MDAPLSAAAILYNIALGYHLHAMHTGQSQVVVQALQIYNQAFSMLYKPFFFDPNYDSIIKPIPTLVSASGRPPQMEPIMFGDHQLAKTSVNFDLTEHATVVLQ